MNTITLDRLPLYSSGKILSLNCNGIFQRRLLDLGLAPNTCIKSIFKSPFGDPTAYEVRGFTIALRNEDAKLIVVNSEN